MAQVPDTDLPPIIARLVTIGTSQYGFLAARPNWDTEIKVSLELPTDVAKEAITLTESRRNFAASARYKMEWTSYLSSAADSTELRIFLTRIRGEPVIVPMWPDVCELQSNVSRGGRVLVLRDLPVRFGVFWIITNEDFSIWEVITISSLVIDTKTIHLPVGGLSRAYSAGTLLYPLILGRLEERPQPEQITDETSDVAFKIKESSAFAYRLTPCETQLTPVGNNLIAPFNSLPLWNIAPNFSRPLDWTEMPDIVYEQVGFLREEQQRVYDHAHGMEDHRNARGQELEFYQSDRASAAKIEYFWRDRRATTRRFMIPTYRGDFRMTTNTPTSGHPTWIKCERSYFSNVERQGQEQPGDPYIALIKNDNTVTPYQLSRAQDTPNETILIATRNVSSHTFTTTIVSHLLLARFQETTLEWTYTTPYMATTRIKFMELPMEYDNTPPELKEPAYLFIFIEAGIRTDRFTSYENTLTIGDTGAYRGTYVPAPFSFETLKTNLKLDEERLEFKSFKFDGNPLNKMWPFALDGILTLEIVEIDANWPRSATAVSRFYGDVWSVDSDYKATAIPFGNMFDRKFPRFLLSVSDNYTQFSPPTKITPGAFVINGQIHGVVNHTSQTLLVTSATGHAKPTDYFAGGWLETGQTANSKEKRGILHSIASGTNDVTLTIDRPLLKAGTNQTLTMYPGYDGSIDQCDTKFNNRVNFGGHPFIPNVNPGVKAMKPKNTQGGKKG